MAFNLGFPDEIRTCKEHAAIVAGVVECVCGAYKAGGRESFDDTIHIHFELVVFGLFNSDYFFLDIICFYMV